MVAATSARAEALATFELARRLEGMGVTATVRHPGVVRTSCGREDSGRWMRLMLPVVRPFMERPEQGAATSIHLASAPEVEGVTGLYFANTRPKEASHASYDAAAAARLWDVSAELVGPAAPSCT